MQRLVEDGVGVIGCIERVLEWDGWMGGGAAWAGLVVREWLDGGWRVLWDANCGEAEGWGQKEKEKEKVAGL